MIKKYDPLLVRHGRIPVANDEQNGCDFLCFYYFLRSNPAKYEDWILEQWVENIEAYLYKNMQIQHLPEK